MKCHQPEKKMSCAQRKNFFSVMGLARKVLGLGLLKVEIPCFRAENGG